MKNFGLLEILILLLALLVILAVFVVVIAMIFPSATAEIVSELRENPELQDNPIIKTISQITRRGSSGFNSRIRPVVDRIVALFTRERAVEEKKIAKAEPAPPTVDFSDCVSSECHFDLYDRIAFNNIYMDHRLHQAEAIDCSTCHLDDKHPKPEIVKEEVCIECHRQKEAVTGCGGCHTPGSILSDEVIFFTTIEEFLSGKLSHSIVPPGFEHPVGEASNACRNCHVVPTFCNKCHETFHDAIPNWIPTHGGRVISGELSMLMCWNCHEAFWCATTCHSNAPSKARRTVPPLKLPRVPLPD